MNSERTDRIIQYVREHPGVSSSEITSGLGLAISSATLRRELARLVSENKLTAEGQNKGTRYFVSPAYDLFAPTTSRTISAGKSTNEKSSTISISNYSAFLPRLRCSPVQSMKDSPVCSSGSGTTSSN